MGKGSTSQLDMSLLHFPRRLSQGGCHESVHMVVAQDVVDRPRTVKMLALNSWRDLVLDARRLSPDVLDQHG